MGTTPRIASVTVAYNPAVARMAAQVAALRGQVDEIVIVDNASDPAIRDAMRALESAAPQAVRVLSLGANLGVGSALNEGMRHAMSAGCDYVLLLDHDSIPTDGMVSALLDAFQQMAAHSRPIAAVGPRVRDSRDGHEFAFVRFGWTHNPHVRCIGETGAVECDFLITSGSLVSRQAWTRVGPFDPTLFIDYVDFDWCCKARAAGYSLFGVCGARLEHELGEEPIVARGVRVLVHAPERTYYMMRNRLLLYQRAHVPMKWKLKDVVRAATQVATSVLFVPPRATQLRMALLALRDGLRGRGGKISRAGDAAG